MRVLGKTNLKINRIGFGGIPIQRVTQQDTNKIIDELINQGINFIDSARGYTVSEEYIGNAIEGKRDKFILASKSMSRTYEDMLKDVDITLKNFKTDYIDLYQLHNVKSDEYENIFNDNMAYKAL
ncbi:aldo/keto reductase family protein [[Clostridium] sordellii ATCC 9714]|nr:aldo/keto reductase family protein [[Clostridium] sordellii ATCC 9714] [Paeniclostridium sordellii ATCC 9714]